MTNRQSAALKTKQKIVEAGEKLIAEKGFDNVSVEDITRASGVAKGTFYTYFKRKEDVVLEISKDSFRELEEEVRSMAGVGIVERLRRFSRKFMQCIERYGIMICRQWVANVVGPEPLPENTGKGKLAFDLESLRSILRAAIGEGQLTEDTPVEELAELLMSRLYGMMIFWCMSDGRYVPSERTDALCDLELERLLAPYIRKKE